MDNRKTELYLTETDQRVLVIGTIIGSVCYVFGIFMAAISFLPSIIFISLALFVTIYLLIYFILGEIKLRYDENHNRRKEIYDIVHYCYPTITDKQYRRYWKIVKKDIKRNKRCLMTMKFEDLLNADKWAQTVEHIKLEHRWTYQLSLQNNCKIRW